MRFMRRMRLLLLIALGVGLAGGHSPGQDMAAGSTATSQAPNLAEESEDWSFSASVYTYIVPEDRDYGQPTVTVDRSWLHLEARYNYENLDTGSAWFGYNFSGGDKLAWEFTPMLGGVFGDTIGVAPGYKGSIAWWKLELYSEGEFFIDPADTSGSYFYNWSELTLAPLEWFRFGVVTQRTRAYESDRDIQRGLLLGFSYRKMELTGYVFNPDDSDPIWVLAFSVNF